MREGARFAKLLQSWLGNSHTLFIREWRPFHFSDNGMAEGQALLIKHRNIVSSTTQGFLADKCWSTWAGGLLPFV